MDSTAKTKEGSGLLAPFTAASRSARKSLHKGFLFAKGTLAFAALLALPNSAWAQNTTTFADLADDYDTQFEAALNLLLAAGFALGAFFFFTGVMKLKQANDTQGQQVKWSDAFWRLIVGIALIALPWLTGVGVATFGGDTSESLSGGGGLTFGGS